MIASFLLRYLPRLFDWFSAFIAGFRYISEEKRTKFAASLHSSAEEIKKTLVAGVLTRLFMLSLLIRVMKYGAQYMFLFALLRPMGYQISTLSVPKVFLGICASETAAGVPFAGVGGFGIYEGTWAIVFKLLGLPGDLATMTGIAFHLCIQFWGYFLGVLAIAILLLPVLRADGPREAKDARHDGIIWFYGKMTACLALLGIAFNFFRH